jgi:hypothetical protein
MIHFLKTLSQTIPQKWAGFNHCCNGNKMLPNLWLNSSLDFQLVDIICSHPTQSVDCQ